VEKIRTMMWSPPFIDPPISSWKDGGKNKDNDVITISELEGLGKNKNEDMIPNVSIHLPVWRWNDMERIRIRIRHPMQMFPI
jgi:hypothetical protein